MGDLVREPVGATVFGEALGWPLKTVGLKVVRLDVGFPVGLFVGVDVGNPVMVPVR